MAGLRRAQTPPGTTPNTAGYFQYPAAPGAAPADAWTPPRLDPLMKQALSGQPHPPGVGPAWPLARLAADLDEPVPGVEPGCALVAVDVFEPHRPVGIR